MNDDLQNLFPKSKKDTALLKRNQEQVAEALSNTNRYYFWRKYGRDPHNDGELIQYYIENGGAVAYAKHKIRILGDKI